MNIRLKNFSMNLGAFVTRRVQSLYLMKWFLVVESMDLLHKSSLGFCLILLYSVRVLLTVSPCVPLVEGVLLWGRLNGLISSLQVLLEEKPYRYLRVWRR